MALATAAERRAVRLEYTAPAACPVREAFAARLAARLGYDPVSEPATHIASVAIQVREGLLEASFSLWESSGPRRNDRSFTAPLTDCDSLLSSVALALAIALDPRLLVRPPPTEPPVTAAPPPPPAPAPPAPVPSPLQLSLAVGVRGAVGLLPAPSGGPVFEARARFGSFSVALDGELSLAPRVQVVGSGQIESSLVRGGLQLCGHVAFAALCARGTGGGLSAGGVGFDNARRGWQPTASVGPLFSVGWRPVGGLVLQAALALDVILVRTSILLGSVELWNSPPVAGNLAVSVGWQFW